MVFFANHHLFSDTQVNKHFESHEKYIEALVPELAKE